MGVMQRERPTTLLRRPAVGAAIAAALAAALYAVVAAAYIAISGESAAGAARTVAELERIELLKGIGFVATTATLLFAALWFLLRRLETERTRLGELERELLEAEAQQLPAMLATSMAHDLSDLVQTAALHAEMLRSSAAPPSLASVADELERSLRKLAAASDRLRDLGTTAPHAQARQRFSVGTLLEDVVELAATHRALRVRGLVRQLAIRAHLHGDRTLLGRAVFNLLVTAGEAAVRQAVLLRATEQGGRLWIEVHDDGPSPAPERRAESIADSLPTRGAGDGLRLISVRAAAETFSGRLEVAPSELGGACFRLDLPMEVEVLNSVRSLG